MTDAAATGSPTHDDAAATREAAPLDRLRAHLARPIDPASLVAFRVTLGLLVALSAARFIWNGWIDGFFLKPSFFFAYWGLDWLVPGPSWAMHGLFGLLVALGLCIAAGFMYRASAVAALVAFTYIELLDVTNYLNHYYLVSLLLLIAAALPLHRAGSLDAMLRPRLRAPAFAGWMLSLVRFQVGVVYVFAGLAKATTDWLVHAQPLNIWLRSRAELPVVGPLLAHWETALAMSWGGFLYDTTIVAFLLWARTRPLAYAAVVGFHAVTGVLFNIGLFPVIMTASALIFFAPSWPRDLLRRLSPRLRARLPERPDLASPNTRPPSGRIDHHLLRPQGRALTALMLVLAAYAAVQLVLPLRTHAYGGDVLWHEQGMRWSWRVMVREKNGSVLYRVRLPGRARDLRVPPSRYLTDHQEREMSGQPDLILQLAHRIADDYRAQGHASVQVRVDAFASLNGRPPARLIDPNVDLAATPDGVARADWILPGPTMPPPHLDAR